MEYIIALKDIITCCWKIIVIGGILDVILFTQQYTTEFKIENKYLIIIFASLIFISAIYVIAKKNGKISHLKEEIENLKKENIEKESPIVNVNGPVGKLEINQQQISGNTNIIKKKN